MSLSWKKQKNETTKYKIPFWKKVPFWAGILVFCILSLSGFLLYRKNKMNALTNNTKSLKSTQVELSTISENVDGSGVLSQAESTNVNLPVGIVVEKIYVEAGDQVKKGDQLVKVKKVSVLSALNSIISEIDAIDEQLEDDDLSDLEIEELNLEKKELTENKKTLNTLKENQVIKATCDGIIGEIYVSEGNETTQNSTSSSTSSSGSSSPSSFATGMSYDTSSTSESINATYMVASLTPETGMITYTSSVDSGNPSSETRTENEVAPSSEANTEDKTTPSSEASTQNETTPSSEASTEKESTPSSEASTQSQPSKETSSTENSSKQTQTSVNKNQPTSNTGKQNGGAAPSTNSGNTQSVTSSNATGSNTSESGTKSYSNYEMCAISIIPLEKVKVSISVDELDILSVEKGQTATVTLDAIEDQEFEGSITNVSSISSSTSGNAKYTVDIELPMTSEMLLGMTASATIHINEATNVPVIPMLALQQERDSTYVYTESDENGNLSGKVEVKTGLSDGSNVEITEGLEEGTTIYYTRSGNTTENNGSFNRMGGEGKMPRMQENGFAPGNSNGGQRPY